MTLQLSYQCVLSILAANHISETVFWFLVGVGAAWFLWACWRIIKRQS